jgi:hypothetical protein
VVTVTLADLGGDQTVMTIEHSQLPSGLVERHEAGWRAVAEQFERELGAIA